MSWMSADGPDGRRHVFPLDLDMPDIPHQPGLRLIRTRPDDRCPLCTAGRCWQHVLVERDDEMTIHGTLVA